MKWIADFKHARAQGHQMRPLWQIPILCVLFPVYILAEKYVDWMDRTF